MGAGQGDRAYYFRGIGRNIAIYFQASPRRCDMIAAALRLIFNFKMQSGRIYVGCYIYARCCHGLLLGASNREPSGSFMDSLPSWSKCSGIIPAMYRPRQPFSLPAGIFFGTQGIVAEPVSHFGTLLIRIASVNLSSNYP